MSSSTQARPVEEGWDGGESLKRRQILAGASSVFMSKGFNGASMGEIARVAEVSKGTLYVYFQNKEQLFEACIDEKRRSFLARVLDFHDEAPVEDELRRFGMALARFVAEPEVIMAIRTVTGIAEQMPELGARFYDNGPGHSARVFAAYLDRKVAAGELAIQNTALAALQFADMCQSNLSRPLLFGVNLSAHERELRAEASVTQAVQTFLATYRHRGADAC
ncbi:TetR/AcrR family transcriptional regulator [Terrihabitans rhizophilus]|uniref:TetR/AcrR family transcriptional regulator n=1 Tax=Terrihabitans rhizophilus TaxID=3092662 RepID=A0ABU4RNI2_9HYPH|nr:TetR/AcrR family transcriptional regulator [Terrihabitans sp. PJ23]MDX6806412.1 TetR/AcrR family transcriptional regulator [Terrihabitans sp. PJ23]